jgi:hypothetical protein
MNVTIDMDQELSKRIVAQTRNGQGYIFSLKRLKLLCGSEQLTSLTVYDTMGDCSKWNIPADLRELRRELYGSNQVPYRLGGVTLTFLSGDLKERIIYLHPDLGSFVKLYLEMTSSETYLCFTAGMDSDADPETDPVDCSGLEGSQLSLFPS